MATRAAGLAGVGAAACFTLALGGFGAALQGYDQVVYPVALLGAAGVPRAGAFNLLAFAVPGLLAAFVALRGRGGLPTEAPLSARLGWTLALLAGLAFALQGFFPLDPGRPDAGSGRLHGAAWGLWGIAFAAAAACLAHAALRTGDCRVASGHAVAGVAVFAFAWLAGDLVPVALSQRAAFAAWFLWLSFAGWRAGAAGRPRRARVTR